MTLLCVDLCCYNLRNPTLFFGSEKGRESNRANLRRGNQFGEFTGGVRPRKELITRFGMWKSGISTEHYLLFRRLHWNQNDSANLFVIVRLINLRDTAWTMSNKSAIIVRPDKQYKTIHQLSIVDCKENQ